MKIIAILITNLVTWFGSVLPGWDFPSAFNTTPAASTIDPEPTMTPKPRPPLEECLLKPSDFGIMAKSYPGSPVFVENQLDAVGELNELSGVYESITNIDNSIGFSIMTFDRSLNAVLQYKYLIDLIESVEGFKSASGADQHPGSSRIMNMENGTVYYVFFAGNIVVLLITLRLIDEDLEKTNAVLSLIGAKEYDHLIACGYINPTFQDYTQTNQGTIRAKMMYFPFVFDF